MRTLAIGILAAVIGCTSATSPTTTPIDGESDPDRLIAELAATGVETEQVTAFSSDPLGGDGLLICVSAEQVRVYLFDSEENAVAAARPDRPR